jgi:hypothetical protein
MIILARALRRAWHRIAPADREQAINVMLIAGLVLSVGWFALAVIHASR